MCPAKLPMSATFSARTALRSSWESSQWSMTSLVTQRRQMASMRWPSLSCSASPSKEKLAHVGHHALDAALANRSA